MNKIYKVVWSKVKNCYVVVSEVAKANGKSGVKTIAAVAAVTAMLSGGMMSAEAADATYAEFVATANNKVIDVAADTAVTGTNQSMAGYTINVGDGVDLTLNELNAVKNVTGNGNVVIETTNSSPALSDGANIDVKNLTINANDNDYNGRYDRALSYVYGEVNINAEETVSISTGDHAIHTEGKNGVVNINAKDVVINSEQRPIMNSGGADVNVTATNSVKFDSVGGIYNWAADQDGEINIKGKTVEMTSPGSYVIQNGGNGAVTVEATDSLVVKSTGASNTAVKLVQNGTAGGQGDVVLKSNGTTVVEGDILNSATGTVDASFKGEESYFKGAAVASNTGDIDFAFNNNASWEVTGDSSVTSITGNSYEIAGATGDESLVVNNDKTGSTASNGIYSTGTAKISNLEKLDVTSENRHALEVATKMEITDVGVVNLTSEKGNGAMVYGDLKIEADELNIDAQNSHGIRASAQDGHSANVDIDVEDLTITATKAGETAMKVSGGANVDVAATGTATVTGDIEAVDGGIGLELNGEQSSLTGAIKTADKGTTTLTMNKGATWNVTGDSNLTNLAGDQANIVVTDGVQSIDIANNDNTDVSLSKDGTGKVATKEDLAALKGVLKGDVADIKVDATVTDAYLTGDVTLDENDKMITTINTDDLAVKNEKGEEATINGVKVSNAGGLDREANSQYYQKTTIEGKTTIDSMGRVYTNHVFADQAITVGDHSTLDRTGLYVGEDFKVDRETGNVTAGTINGATISEYKVNGVVLDKDGDVYAKDIMTTGTLTSMGKVTAMNGLKVQTAGAGNVVVGNIEGNTMLYTTGANGYSFGVEANTGNIETKGSLRVGNDSFTVDTVGNTALKGSLDVGKDVKVAGGVEVGTDVKAAGDVYAGDVSLKETADKVGQNSDAIASNAAAIKDNANAIAGLDTRVSGNEADIASNAAAITQNQKDIASNAAAIKDNANAIAGLDTRVSENEKDIKANADAIASNATAIKGNADAIADLANAGKANADAIAGLDSRVSENEADIKANADAITENQKDIASNAAAITENQRDIASNAAAITQNQTDIASNANAIRDNSTAIASNAQAITDNRNAIAGLGQQLNSLDNRVDKVGAGAAALAALHPLDYDAENKLSFAAGVGNYAGATAAAVGAFYRPNEDVMFSIGGTAGNGENMVNAGVSFAIGKGSSGTAAMSKAELVQEVTDLKAENKELQEENKDIRNELNKLKAMVMELAAKK